jgi:hypothetical protein
MRNDSRARQPPKTKLAHFPLPLNGLPPGVSALPPILAQVRNAFVTTVLPASDTVIGLAFPTATDMYGALSTAANNGMTVTVIAVLPSMSHDLPLEEHQRRAHVLPPRYHRR